jgi:Fe-S-cluster containining protein
MKHEELSQKISAALTEVSDVFSKSQKKEELTCPPGCGKCCFKSDISCSPYELLPMAFSILKEGRAEKILEKAIAHNSDHCLFLEVSNEKLGTGSCSEYPNRPFVCRAFGLSLRHNKYQMPELSICKTLGHDYDYKNNSDIPFIEDWKKKFESVDPCLLEVELPIHEGMAIMLNKLLLWNFYENKSN